MRKAPLFDSSSTEFTPSYPTSAPSYSGVPPPSSMGMPSYYPSYNYPSTYASYPSQYQQAPYYPPSSTPSGTPPTNHYDPYYQHQQQQHQYQQQQYQYQQPPQQYNYYQYGGVSPAASTPAYCRICNRSGHTESQCASRSNQTPFNNNKNNNNTHNKNNSNTPNTNKPTIFKCEPCSKEFKIKSQYDTHLSTHVNCKAPDCDFSASNKVVLLHYRTSHERAPVVIPQAALEAIPEKYRYVTKIGYSPEEIEKWKEDRRKSWPSASNIQQKKDERARKQTTGELDSSSNNYGLKRKRENNNQRDNHGDNNKRQKTSLTKAEKAENALMKEEDLLVLSNEEVEGEEKDVNKRLCKYFAKNGHCKNGDRCKYEHGPKPISLCRNFKKGDCNKGDACPYSHDKVKRRLDLIADREKVSAKKQPNTLLKKLLEKEQRKESSLLLQCVRFFTTNNFLMEPKHDDHKIGA